MFIRKDELRVEGDPGPLFLDDALYRLTPSEKRSYEELGKIGGFLFTGNKYTCVVVVSLSTNVMLHGNAPTFCYDKITNKFVERL